MSSVRTRIAPSPTGFPHIGTIYQVLIDFAYARKLNGTFILRLEDTDRARLVAGAEEVLYDALSWFGLDPDEGPLQGGAYGPYRQSERLAVYQTYADELLQKGHAYYCFCTKERLDAMRKEQEAKHLAPRYDRTCLRLTREEITDLLARGVPHVVRMRVPQKRSVTFHDLIAGDITFDSEDIDDQVIMKSDGFPTYHFAVVVDDHLMEITHVFRGKEWISSTPKHVLLYEFFGWTMPTHAHLPLILNEDGKGKLSKRHGHASVDYYRKQGYLPQAVLNYLSHIIWNHPDGKEIYSVDEFIRYFDITHITSQAPRFDVKKLDWINSQYIKNTSDEALVRMLKNFEQNIATVDEKTLLPMVRLTKERMRRLAEFWTLAGFFFERPGEFERPLSSAVLIVLREALKGSDWNHESMEQVIRDAALKATIPAKDVFMELRLAITGKTVGPPLLESLEILGREETLSRLYV